MGKAMMRADAARQTELEARLQLIWQRGVAQDATIPVVFGPLESWQLQVGLHRLLLDPLQKQWLHYDPLHDSWQPTGIGPGEGIFYAWGKRLGLQRPAEAPRQPPREAAGTGTNRCPACAMRIQPTQRYCNRCGQPLQSEAADGHRP